MKVYKTLIEAIKSSYSKNNVGITYITGDTKNEYMPYIELFESAKKVLFNLQKEGIGPGNKLIIQIDDNATFLCTFWACILGGIIPVPIVIGNNHEHKLKLIRIYKQLESAYLITDLSVLNSINSFADSNGFIDELNQIGQKIVLVEDMFNHLENEGELYEAKPSDIAFIQFSSGSTGNPKGIVLTHENLSVNIEAIIEGAKINETDSTLSWMPLSHDMGLIGFHLVPLYSQIDQFIMPTALFIRHPKLWMKKAFEYKATLLSSPNFGYQYFLDSFTMKDAEDWDFSHVRLIFNGAEPILVEKCNDFLDVMAKYNLKRTCMFPVYGLAEGSLAITFPPIDEELIEVKIERKSIIFGQSIKYSNAINEVATFVDLGFPVKNCSIEIRDDKNRILKNDMVGNIYIKGKNVTGGYFNSDDLNKAFITSDGWLNTGDLGFIKCGRLIVTGRAKDIICVNGQNYYPHDIEQVAQELNEISLGKIAACSIFDDETQSEDIYIFVLYKKGLQNFLNVMTCLKIHIQNRLDLEVKEIIPIRKIPKTTSGKFQRYKLAEMIKNGEFLSLTQEIRELAKLRNLEELIKNR